LVLERDQVLLDIQDNGSKAHISYYRCILWRNQNDLLIYDNLGIGIIYAYNQLHEQLCYEECQEPFLFVLD